MRDRLSVMRTEKPVEMPAPPPGPLLSAADIARIVFNGSVTARWVLRHCPRVELTSNTIRFLEIDVRKWIDEKRRSA